MKEFFINLYARMKAPKKWFLAVWYLLTVIFCALAIVFAILGSTSSVMEILSYVLYGVAAITLSYTVYTIVIFAPKLKRKTVEFINRFAFGRRLLSHYGFRTIVFSAFALAVSIAYVAFHVVLAIVMRSFWYGSLALYYALLVALRGGIVLYHRKKGKRVDFDDTKAVEVRKYRNCGIILTIIPLCLVVPILQIIFLDKAFVHEGWTVFAFAAYAFYKIIMSIINVVRAKRQEDVTVRAVRNVGLADAMVSIFSLQTSLLYTFSEGTDYVFANVLTGSAVCLLTIALGIYMIIKSKKGLNNG